MPKIFTKKEILEIQKEFIEHYKDNMSVNISSELVRLSPKTILRWLALKENDSETYSYPDFIKAKREVDSSYIKFGLDVLKREISKEVPDTKLILRYLDSNIFKESDVRIIQKDISEVIHSDESVTIKWT